MGAFICVYFVFDSCLVFSSICLWSSFMFGNIFLSAVSSKSSMFGDRRCLGCRVYEFDDDQNTRLGLIISEVDLICEYSKNFVEHHMDCWRSSYRVAAG